MTTGYVINLDNGHNGYCIESLRCVTFCGETFDPTEVEREPYTIEGRDENHRHAYLCYDCSKADSSCVRGAARGVEA